LQQAETILADPVTLEQTYLPYDEVRQRVAALLARHGVTAPNAAILADVIVAAERDGSHSHGFSRLPGYIATLHSGWARGDAVPVVQDVAPALVRVDGRNGFTQIATDAARDLLESKCKANGIACLAVFNSHHFAALWADVEPWAARGYLAITFVNSRPRMSVWHSRGPVLGTNPMAFACPRDRTLPLVWDQASSVRSQGDILIASRTRARLPDGVGLDANGHSTTDPDAILKGGSLLPMGGHKGGAIALMVELMVAALGGGHLGFEDRASDYPGAVTCNTGQTLIVIDPMRASGGAFAERVEALIAFFMESGVQRLPSGLRYTRRIEALVKGISVSSEILTLLSSA
jgi:delta1-piperideine-2-carboxylate reductase